MPRVESLNLNESEYGLSEEFFEKITPVINLLKRILHVMPEMCTSNNIIKIFGEILFLIYQKRLEEQNDLYIDLSKSILVMFAQFSSLKSDDVGE